TLEVPYGESAPVPVVFQVAQGSYFQSSDQIFVYQEQSMPNGCFKGTNHFTWQ
ncbi:hypothetical protein KI387_025224, partial [Taxus chinensis]